MTTLRDLPPGTRCLVDVAAMERDGPDNKHRADCWKVTARHRVLLGLAEQVVVVLYGPEAVRPLCEACGSSYRSRNVYGTVCVTVPEAKATGYSFERKYLVPLPEQGGETERR